MRGAHRPLALRHGKVRLGPRLGRQRLRLNAVVDKAGQDRVHAAHVVHVGRQVPVFRKEGQAPGLIDQLHVVFQLSEHPKTPALGDVAHRLAGLGEPDGRLLGGADADLARRDEAFNDPVHGTAVQNLFVPARTVAGAVDVFRRQAHGRELVPAVFLETGKMLDRIDADAKFDDMHGHGSQPSRRHQR